MKAIVSDKYGPASQLKLKEVQNPSPKGNEVLIEVEAAAVNDWDWSMVRGKPYIYRLMMGLFKPKYTIPGVDVAGTIVAIGNEVSKFKIGDQVFGDLSECGFGAFAEYVCANENALAIKPASMSFEQAASIPHAAILALQGLDNGQIQKGQSVLVNGAGGGVGTFAVQLARQYDAEVTGVDSTEKLAMLKANGYDHVIDYQKEDFTKSGKLYDLILDAKTTRSPLSYARVLKPNGTYITVGGKLTRMIQILLLRKSIARRHQKNILILSLKPNKGLSQINALFEAGHIKCQIDGPFKLDEVPKAIQYFGEGRHKGKIVISIR